MKKQISLLLAFTGSLITSGCESVVNMFAFYPDKKDVIAVEQLPEHVQEIFIRTEDKVSIQGYYLPHEDSDQLLIYFHGNAGNIGHRLPDLIKLHSFGINVLGVGYRGYGKSEGSPSELGLYLDGEAAFDYATEKLHFPISKIIIFGRSIGSTVAVHTSQNRQLGGLILVTPLTSGKQHAQASGLGFLSSIAGKSFDNLSKIKNIQCPLLVVHGTNDEVVPYSMGQDIYNKATVEKQFVAIQGADHNNLSAYSTAYWDPIRKFIYAKK